MTKKMKKLLALLLTLCMAAGMTNITSYAEESADEAEAFAVKTSESINREEDRYKIEINVPGKDGEDLHDEVILMVDGSYSGDDEWGSMVNTITEIAKTVLNGEGNTQLTLMAFGMAHNEVIAHAKTVEEVQACLGSLPGSLLYGRSSTNCEAGFDGVDKYINNHDDSLNSAYVIYISDANVNMHNEEIAYDQWETNGWSYLGPEKTAKLALAFEFDAILYGAEPSAAVKNVLEINDENLAIIKAAYDNVVVPVGVSVNSLVKWVESIVIGEQQLVTKEVVFAYENQVWNDVYAAAGLTRGEKYDISTVETAFVDYDNANGTYIQNAYYYMITGKDFEKTGYGQTRTVEAGETLAANSKVNAIYMVETDNGGNAARSAWAKNITADNYNYLVAKNYTKVVEVLGETLTDLSKTPYNDVVVTDYMSKWVTIDLDTIKVVDNVTDQVIYTAKDGWLIDEKIPTAHETAVVIEEVSAEEYEAGGEEVVGNTNGTIYKLTWYVKDGALLRTDSYHLEYEVVVDTAEEGFVYGTDYAANGTTELTYVDENGEDKTEEIEVPEVVVEKYTITVNYLDKATGEQLSDSYVSELILKGTTYDVADKDDLVIEGYEFDSVSGDELQGTLEKDIVINVYYSQAEEELEELPDEDVPLGGTPEVPETSEDEEVELPEEDVPLGGTPEVPENEEVEIEDEDVPLESAPKTGDNTSITLWVVVAIAAVVVMAVSRRKEVKEK